MNDVSKQRKIIAHTAYGIMCRNLSVETPSQLYGEHFHFRRKHIYINFNFLYYFGTFNRNYFNSDYISKDHKVHIYLSVDSFIDEYMYYFIAKCKDATDKIVTIHIDKRDWKLKEKIEKLLEDLDNWQLISEKHVMVSQYLFDIDYTNNTKTYLCISYYYKDKIERIKFGYYKEKKG